MTLGGITVVAALTLSACGTGADDSSTTGSSTTKPRAQQWTPGMSTTARPPATTATALPPAEAGVDRSDPDAVALAAMTIWFDWDTARDTGPNDAAARSAPLLSPDYARAMTSGAPQSGPGADWAMWKSRSAHLVPTVRRGAEPVPPATPSKAYAQVVVDQAVTLPDGTVTEHRESVVAVTLTKGSQGWEVSTVRLR
ncbi:MAG: hypothetical protein H5T78_03080 [Nocardia sp.]|nr:hypothetical protein [Nocardia sp.]